MKDDELMRHAENIKALAELLDNPNRPLFQHDLGTVQGIKRAIEGYLGGHNSGVFASRPDTLVEHVVRVRKRWGKLEVRSGEGQWFVPGRVWVEA